MGINQIIHSLENGTDPESIMTMMTNLCVDLDLGNFIFCDNFIHIAEVGWRGRGNDSLFGVTVVFLLIISIKFFQSSSHFVYIFYWYISFLLQPQLFWIIENTENLYGKDACGMLFPGFGCDSDNPARVWEVIMPNTTKPPITRPPLPEVRPSEVKADCSHLN